MFGNTFKILCSLRWIQGLVPEDERLPLPPKPFSTPNRARGFTGSCVLTGIVQLLSHVWHFVVTCTTAKQASLSFSILRSFLNLMSIELVMPSHHLILLTPLLLPTIFPSIRVSSNELALHIRWPKCWSFIFSISLCIEYCSTTSKTKLMFPFIPVPKKGNAKECPNYLTIALISHASKVMLKILQASQPSKICGL